MKSLLAAAPLVLGVAIALLLPEHGAAAVLVCTVLSLPACLLLVRGGGADRYFLLRIFAAGLLARVLVGTAIFSSGLQQFFGGDAMVYDELGHALAQVWRGQLHESLFMAEGGRFMTRDMGMPYVVGAIYYVTGRNMLAVQFASAVLGAATAPLIYLCAHHIFQNLRVARLSAVFVAFYPSLVLWSSQGLKDGPVVFLLALSMLATLRLTERLSVKQLLVLVVALFGIHSLRFYIFYMALAAACGAFFIGKSPVTARSVARQTVVVVALGMAMTYMGVLRTASSQLETFGTLEMMQQSRFDLARSADSGFGKDVDVSTTGGALTAIPAGMVYLLFAPFPWQLANLRQLITLPEMLVWWASFPLVVVGLWFTIKYRARQALPILIFTTMLTLAYSIVQGNVGTAYRQRSQLLVFYFIFASVGFILLRERGEDRRRRLAQEVDRGRGWVRGPRSPDASRPPALANVGAAGPAVRRDLSVDAAGDGEAVNESWARAAGEG